MKKIIVTLGCVLIALLAFAQPSSTDKKQGTTTTEPIEVTGTIIRTMIAEGAAACSQRTWSRCEQGRGNRPNSDQTRHARARLLRRHGRFAYD